MGGAQSEEEAQLRDCFGVPPAQGRIPDSPSSELPSLPSPTRENSSAKSITSRSSGAWEVSQDWVGWSPCALGTGALGPAACMPGG